MSALLLDLDDRLSFNIGSVSHSDRPDACRQQRSK
jgi:hypothetical protein